MASLKEVQKLPVQEGHGYVLALFEDLWTEVKLVHLRQDGNKFQGNCHVKERVTRRRNWKKLNLFCY
nr:hypothetical protein Iba_chr12bCG7260 [Ipomoea batatas]GMD71868.1 hypothetical protein Iba_chr12fCG3040 [Ipomoea batatas]